MNWLESIEEAIGYIESHLKDDLSVEDVASHVYMSSGYFQKAFSMLCGFTVSEYIRNRRLAEAGMELLSSDGKIIDIALMYGYDSHDSFTKAFSRFHGVTPSAVRRGGCTLKAFAPLRLKFILGGGYIMDYRIEKLDAFKVLCKRTNVKKPMEMENDAVKEITDFWAECGKNGTTEKIISYFPNKKIKGLLGISFSSELNGNKFPYGIGVEYDGREIKDADLEIVEIPAHTFAVFTCKGKMPEAFNEVYRKIVSEFFPQSTKYEYGWGVELEVYPSQDISNPDYTCEIWIAVKEK